MTEVPDDKTPRPDDRLQDPSGFSPRIIDNPWEDLFEGLNEEETIQLWNEIKEATGGDPLA